MDEGYSGALNPALYNVLGGMFGRAIIARQGEALYGRPVNTLAESRQFALTSSGEYYRVNCPFCSDTRQRLWINHRWGVGPEYMPRERMWWAAYCYNCEFDWEGRQRLRSMVYTPGKFRRKVLIYPGQVYSGELYEINDPGECIPINELPAGHHAAEYLTYRELDLDVMAKDYDVKFCVKALPESHMAQDRIIFPVRMDNKYVGWQARYAGDLNWKQAGVPKYYNVRGVPRRQWLYGYDHARAFNFCIIVEGVTDVIAVGPPAVALLGKSMSMPQFQNIFANWSQVILALDDDAYYESEMLFHTMQQQGIIVNRVNMPAKTDPASIIRQNPTYFWDMVNAAAGAANMQLLMR